MITEQQKSPETPIFIVRKQTWPSLAQIITLQNPKLGPDNNFTAYICICICICIYIYTNICAAGCLIEPYFLHETCENVVRKWFFDPKGPKKGAPISGSIKHPWIFASILPFYFAPFPRGKTGFFALLLLPGGPETQGIRRFFAFLGRNAGGIAFSFFFFVFLLFLLSSSSSSSSCFLLLIYIDCLLIHFILRLIILCFFFFLCFCFLFFFFLLLLVLLFLFSALFSSYVSVCCCSLLLPLVLDILLLLLLSCLYFFLCFVIFFLFFFFVFSSCLPLFFFYLFVLGFS